MSATAVGHVFSAQGRIHDVRLSHVGGALLFDSLVGIGGGPANPLVVVQRISPLLVRCVTLLGTPSEVPLGTELALVAGEPRALVDATVQEVVARVRNLQPGWIPTGIKAVDLLAPLPAGGCLGVLGDPKAGRSTFVAELVHRLSEAKERAPLTVFVLVTPSEAEGTRRNVASTPELAPGDVFGSVQVVWLVTPRARDAHWAADGVFDSTLYFSAARAITGLHPPIDPLRSESRLLAAAGPLGSRHVKAALGVRRIMREAAQMTAAPVSLFLTPPSLTQGARRPPDENELAVKAAPAHALERARRLDRYFAQPFYVSEGATGMAGTHVGVGEALGACEELLEGDGAPVVGETEMTGVRTLQGHDVRWISGDRVAVEGEVAPLRVAYDRSEK